MRRKNTKNHRKIAFFIIFWLSIALLAGARVYHVRKQAANIKLPDAGLEQGIYRFRKNAVLEEYCRNPFLKLDKLQLNNEGFRGGDLKTGQNYVAVFGDSYVFGMCLKDNETISHFLKAEMDALGLENEVVNFGMLGYNLRSTLMLANQMVDRYSIPLAVIYFLLEDDLLECDISCQQAMRERDPIEYQNFRKTIEAYLEQEHKNSEELIRAGFEKLFSEQVIERGLHKKTSLVFVLIGTQRSEVITGLLDQYQIRYVQLQEDFCNEILQNCKVPLDGHPSGFFNSQAAKQIAGAIKGWSDNQAQ